MMKRWKDLRRVVISLEPNALASGVGKLWPVSATSEASAYGSNHRVTDVRRQSLVFLALWLVFNITILRESSLSADEEGYVSLFNGENLDGWVLRRASRRGFTVEDGMLVCPAGSGGYLFTENQYGDFGLRFDFRLSEGANSGVAIRSPLLDSKPAYEAMEIQILDNLGYKKEIRPTQFHGSLYDVVGAKRGALKPAGQWNSQEILCRGRKITVIVNRQTILDVDLSTIKDPEVLAKHPGLARDKGHIGLLGHNSRIEFKNLRIKPLSRRH